MGEVQEVAAARRCIPGARVVSAAILLLLRRGGTHNRLYSFVSSEALSRFIFSCIFLFLFLPLSWRGRLLPNIYRLRFILRLFSFCFILRRGLAASPLYEKRFVFAFNGMPAREAA